MSTNDDSKLTYKKDPPKAFEGFEDLLEKNKRSPEPADSFWNKYNFWIKLSGAVTLIAVEIMFGGFIDWFVKAMNR